MALPWSLCPRIHPPATAAALTLARGNGDDLLKAAISGIVVMLASEAARYKPAAGGLIASLPLVSLLAAIWLWREAGDSQRIALLLESTF